MSARDEEFDAHCTEEEMQEVLQAAANGAELVAEADAAGVSLQQARLAALASDDEPVLVSAVSFPSTPNPSAWCSIYLLSPYSQHLVHTSSHVYLPCVHSLWFAPHKQHA
jgi:hypothetical protein